MTYKWESVWETKAILKQMTFNINTFNHYELVTQINYMLYYEPVYKIVVKNKSVHVPLQYRFYWIDWWTDNGFKFEH